MGTNAAWRPDIFLPCRACGICYSSESVLNTVLFACNLLLKFLKILIGQLPVALLILNLHELIIGVTRHVLLGLLSLFMLPFHAIYPPDLFVPPHLGQVELRRTFSPSELARRPSAFSAVLGGVTGTVSADDCRGGENLVLGRPGIFGGAEVPVRHCLCLGLETHIAQPGSHSEFVV